MQTLAQLEEFMRLLHAAERVKRVARRPNEREATNVAEHTFEIALVSWYILKANKLELDMGKVLRYALAHDLVEAYAGDTYIYDAKAKETKSAREAGALKRIEHDIPEFEDLTATIREYEERTTPEAKFVYAIDKLIDPVNLGMETKSSMWKERNVTFGEILDYKSEKIALSDPVVPYWEQLKEKLLSHKDFYFNE